MRIPAALVVLNAQRGVAVLMARRAEVLAMPGISIEQIESLSDLGQALQYASCVASRRDGSWLLFSAGADALQKSRKPCSRARSRSSR
jgi:hypothetical protein